MLAACVIQALLAVAAAAHCQWNGRQYKIATAAFGGDICRSQGGEDAAVYELFFQGRRNGTFVEMGALDGELFSNTFAYEKGLGWSGILIEANQVMCANIPEKRPRSVAVCTAISNDSQPVKFETGWHPAVFAAVDQMNSTWRSYFHSAHHRIDSWDKRKPGTEVLVPSQPLSKVLQDNGIREIDFFSLDVEGSEATVLRTMDWTIPVRVWLIEKQLRNSAEVDDIMAANGYIKAPQQPWEQTNRWEVYDALYVRPTAEPPPSPTQHVRGWRRQPRAPPPFPLPPPPPLRARS